MLRKRVIVCLDVKDGRVVKGVSFEGLRDMGDPVELATRYEAEGADEIVFLDISASAEGRRTLLDVVRRTAERLFIPLTVGGGINDVEDVARALRAGADKVSINTAGVRRPELFTEAAERFGAQCVVASIDAKRVPAQGHEAGSAAGSAGEPGRDSQVVYRVYTHGGRTPTELEAVAWAARCAELGAGEILLTSIDEDGRRNGFDLELTGRVVRAVTVPVIASGGAGRAEHFRDAFLIAGADAALAAGMFHDGSTTVGEVKRVLAEAGIPVRAGREVLT
ncbi:MAG TPA: imidazole glycerol phosphate synthase subunit HisF [Longimicrobiales bacterium]